MEIKKDEIIAVVGVSLDENKYGNKVFFNLLYKGYKVFAVHPDGGQVKNHNRYPSIFDLLQKPNLVVSVVKPEITEKVAIDCLKLGIKKFWMQPGSESRAVLEFCQHNGIEVVSQDCIIIATNN
jgi:predicted CoA-binding protein